MDFADDFKDLDAQHVYKQLQLRNADELVEEIEAHDGDKDALTHLLTHVAEHDDYEAWDRHRQVTDEDERKLKTVLPQDLIHKILYTPRDEWLTNLDEIQVEQEGETVVTEALIHAVKELPNTRTVTWQCTECDEETTTYSNTPYKQPSKPARCSNCDNTAKKYFRYVDSDREHGFQLRITRPNQLPSQDTRVASVWVALDDIDINNGDNDGEHAVASILEGYGTEIEIKGDVHFKIDTSRGEIKNTELWILADHIKQSESEIEQINFTESDRDEIRRLYNQYDDERGFFDEYLSPQFIGRERMKRAVAYTMATPLVLDKQNGEVADYGVGRMMIVGDPGTAKSKTTNTFVKSTLNDLGAEQVSAEYLSDAGLGGTVTKNKDGFWEIDWGLLPHVHRSGLVLDGMHNFDKKWLSKLREIMEESVIKIVKAAKGEARCATRIVGIANTNLYPIRDHYSTNYQASFDIGIGGDDDTNKLSGADRRRWDLIWVMNDDDVPTSDIDDHLLSTIGDTDNDRAQFLWNKLWAWMWNLEYDDYDWSKIDELRPRIVDMLEEWRTEYPNADLAVTGNKGARIIASYVMASAALHCRLNDDGEVSPTEDDVENVRSLFEDMFDNLELERYEKGQQIRQTVAQAIADHLLQQVDDEDGSEYRQLVEIIQVLGEDPNMSMESVAERVGVTRKTVYNRLNMELEIDVDEYTVSGYTAMDGYRDNVADIPAMVDSGRLTPFGKNVLQCLGGQNVMDQVDIKSFVLDRIEELDSGDGVDIKDVLESGEFAEDRLRNILDDMISEGDLYEPKAGKVKVL